MDASPRQLGLTLSGLYFLAFFAPGAIFTAGFTFLARPLGVGGLGLTPGQLAAVAASGALGGLAAIALVHKLHAVTYRRALTLLFVVGAILIGLLATFADMYATAQAMKSDASEGAPAGVVTVIAVVLCLFTATNSAASASVATLIQQCIAGTGLSFYRLRAAGTWGWICGGASLQLVTPVSTQPFWLGCAAMLVAAAYTCAVLGFLRECPAGRCEVPTLTSSPRGREGFPVKELAFVLILVGSTAILGRLYDTFGNQFLTEIHFPRVCATQPLLAQFPEFLLLLLVPFAALPLKYCFLLGPLSWVCVFLGFFLCGKLDNHLAIYLSLPFQAGNCIMQTTASIAVDSLFQTSRFRRTAQATLPFVQGTGLLLGSLIAGALVSSTTSSAGTTNWNQVWLIAGLAATVATVLAGVAMAQLPLGRFRKHDPRAALQVPSTAAPGIRQQAPAAQAADSEYEFARL